MRKCGAEHLYVKQRPRYKCSAGFEKCHTKQDIIQQHLINHPSPEIQQHYNCEICGKSFSSKKYLKQHEKTLNHLRKCGAEHLYVKQEKYVCESCCKAHHSKQGLINHAKSHLLPVFKQYYNCEFCGEKFIWNHSLENHRKRHIVEDQGYEHCY